MTRGRERCGRKGRTGGRTGRWDGERGINAPALGGIGPQDTPIEQIIDLCGARSRDNGRGTFEVNGRGTFEVGERKFLSAIVTP